MTSELRPNESELAFLTLAYNRFYDLFEEAIDDSFWEEDKKRMTYLSITFPSKYDDNTKVFLRDILSEKEGIKFSFILMKQIMSTQIDRTD